MKLWVSEEKLKMSMVEDKHVESFSVLYEQCDILWFLLSVSIIFHEFMPWTFPEMLYERHVEQAD